jgi:hypothetical protein
MTTQLSSPASKTTPNRKRDKMEMNHEENSAKSFTILSRMVLDRNDTPATWGTPPESAEISAGPASFAEQDWIEQDWVELGALASMNHVILRAFPPLRSLLQHLERQDRAEYMENALEKEQARIGHAMSFLSPICLALEGAGNTIVIKSLDHWPDFGSDLDLFAEAEPADVISIMRRHFDARVAKRSWGDRLANKWNFIVPGLPELVEVHVRRLGQMGEQRAIGGSLVAHAVSLKIGSYNFRVPAPEDRIVVSTLQRMFRHFYIRLCDIVDIAKIVDQNVVDYDYLRSLAQLTGLWDGVATYLKIVSDYVREYRGHGLPLPSFVVAAARFGNEQVRFRKKFLRIPIMPHSARLYAAELSKLLSEGEVGSTVRLSLLPALATAAALKQRVTANDTGIW